MLLCPWLKVIWRDRKPNGANVVQPKERRELSAEMLDSPVPHLNLGIAHILNADAREPASRSLQLKMRDEPESFREADPRGHTQEQPCARARKRGKVFRHLAEISHKVKAREIRKYAVKCVRFGH